MKIRILHTHPNRRMAKIFITPLLKEEAKNGFLSKLIYCNNTNPFSTFLMIKSFRPDILISHNSTTSIIPMIAARILRVKKIIYFNHGVPYVGHKSIIRFILFKIENLNCFIADYVYTVSDDMDKLLKQFKPKKLFLSKPGSVSGISLKTVKNVNFRKSYNIDKKTTIICYVGRPVKRKGFHLMLEVWRKYFLNDENYILLLCGPNNKDIKEQNLLNASNIIPLGFIDYVLSAIKVSDIMVLPSFHEGLSYAVLESLSVKCPVITSNIPGIKSIIKHRFNGILIDIEDNKSTVDILFNEIVKLNNNEKLKQKLKKNGFITAKKFQMKEVLYSYIKNLNEIISTGLK
jgi:glycosyltransferase involved in cell wall biosynthesis